MERKQNETKIIFSYPFNFKRKLYVWLGEKILLDILAGKNIAKNSSFDNIKALQVLQKIADKEIEIEQ